MYELDESKYLYLLLLLPFLVILFVWMQFWKQKKQTEFGDSDLVKKLSPEKSNVKPIVKFVLFLFGMIMLIFGLVNPKIGTKTEKVKSKGIDIVFAIDVSKSMLAEDIAPNRLEKSKQIVSQVIGNLKSDRIGIIAYSGSAFPVLPITTDYNIAKMYLQTMNPGMISSQGSNLNEAIQLSETYFEGREKSKKLLIMVTDGEDHSEEAESAAGSAANKGIQIITVGVGTTSGGPIPIKNNGVLESYHIDKATGDKVITKLRPEALQAIADASKGYYADGTSTKQVVNFILKKINASQKSEFEAVAMADFQSQYQWFIGVVFFVLLLDVFLLERKTKWVQKLDLFNEKKEK
ncbi:VWA domain-containing protein [Flavobacterium sp. GCM10027622]|uniref:VWA domain-containing protein n=1 Tax=unclassified Flavobacterium TaxID=196869 RepID=UPI00361C9705